MGTTARSPGILQLVAVRLVRLTADPHASKCRQGRQNGSTDPRRDHALWRSNGLDLGGLWHKIMQLNLEALWCIGGSTGHDNVSEEAVGHPVTVVGSLPGRLAETQHLLTIEGRLQHEL